MVTLKATYRCILSDDIVRIDGIYGDTVVLYNITKKGYEASNLHLIRKFYKRRRVIDAKIKGVPL